MLKKYADVPLDSDTSIKDCEHEFEKFYFISMVGERKTIESIKFAQFNNRPTTII